MRSRIPLIALLVGAAAFTTILVLQGPATIAATLQTAGLGVLLVPALYLPFVVLPALAWRLLFPPGRAPRLRVLLAGSWISLAINWLLPVAQVGGELARARIAHRHGSTGREALASVVIDKSVQVAVQLALTLIALTASLAFYPDERVLLGAIAFLVLFSLLLVAFVRAQQRGIFARVSAFAQRMTPAFSASPDTAAGIDDALRDGWSRRGRWLGAFALLLGFRIALLVEVLLAMHLLGHDVTIVEALIIEGLSQTIRSVSFIIPGSLGAMEGGLVLVGAAMGIPQPVAFSLALCKRVREIVLGVPALIGWQIGEARALMATTATNATNATSV